MHLSRSRVRIQTQSQTPVVLKVTAVLMGPPDMALEEAG